MYLEAGESKSSSPREPILIFSTRPLQEEIIGSKSFERKGLFINNVTQVGEDGLYFCDIMYESLSKAGNFM